MATMHMGCSDDAETHSSDASTSASGTGSGGGATTGTTTGTTTGGGGTGGSHVFLCSSVRDQALGPIDQVSGGDVTILSDDNGTKEVYVDASAGGFQMASVNPYIYLDLDAAARIDITDPDSFDDAGWDIAIKRVGWRNNSAHSGAGDGGAAFLAGASFDTVVLSSAMSANLVEETWFDDMCNYEQDPTGALVTSMTDWYDYDGGTMAVTPKDGVYVIRGGDGSSYFKLQILNYYTNPDGSTGMASGRYLLRIATL